MQLEDQVSNPILSKKLRELGVKQESVFYWKGKKLTKHKEVNAWREYLDQGSSQNAHKIVIGKNTSAFSVAELGMILPEGFQSNRIAHDGGFISWSHDKNHVENDQNEADARARMLIYLIENNLLK